MKLLISLTATVKFEAGQRVAVEFGPNDWSIGTIVKATPTGFKIDFDYGDLGKLIKSTQGRVIKVDQKRKLKKALTYAEVKVLKAKPEPKKPAVKIVGTTVKPTKATNSPKPVVPVKPATTPKVKTVAPVDPEANEADTKEEITLAHKVGNEHLFKTAQAGKNPDKIKYMEFVWGRANDLLFANKMNKPLFAVLKNMGITHFKGLGGWNAGLRRLRVSPRLFNATQSHTIATIVHEMCHQAVSDIERTSEGNGGHGPIWESYMRKCGLVPSRYSKTDRMEFLTEEERSMVSQQKAMRENAHKTVDQPKLSAHELKAGTAAQYFSAKEGRWNKGLIVCRKDKAGKNIIFITEPFSHTWRIIGSVLFHALDKSEQADYKTEAYLNAAQRIRNYLDDKAEQRRREAARRAEFKAMYS